MTELQQVGTKKDEGFNVTPISFDQAREVLRSKFNDGRHWLLIIHAVAADFLVEIEDRYYAGVEENQDLTVVVAHWRGEAYGLVCAHKRRMRPYQLASFIRQRAGCRVRERDLTRRDTHVIAPDTLAGDAMDLLDHLTGRLELAVAE